MEVNSPNREYGLIAHAARHVLDDGRYALMKLESAKDGRLWRVLWVSVVSHQRMIRDLLLNKDKEHCYRALGIAIDKWWTELQANKPVGKPEIYWGFIANSLNYLQHRYDWSILTKDEYKFNIDPLDAEKILTVTQTGTPSVYTRGIGSIPKRLLQENGINFIDSSTSAEITQGPFKGKLPQEVAKEAFDWWENEIERIELNAEKKHRAATQKTG